jgi:thiosulfate reductase/polysulfide reductase chain A
MLDIGERQMIEAKKSLNRDEALSEIKDTKRTRSFCFICPFHCVVDVYVRDGRIVYLKGAEEAANQGGRCGKGMAGVELVTDPDRLKYPLKRIGKRGEGKFERISWDEALDIISNKLMQIREKYGPEAVLFEFGRNPQVNFISHLLTDLYGTPNIYGHTSICEMDRRLVALQLYGHVYPVRDFENCKYAVLWGINPLGSNQMLYESRELLRSLERGMKLVVVDPVLSQTAEKAHEWIPIKPGTDGALALAMARVIIDEDLYDHDFVRNRTQGFDKYRRHLREKEYTPEWAATITDVPAETIIRLAREFATTKPGLMEIFKGLGNYTNGVDASRAVYILNALTGNIDGPGNLILKEFSSLGPAIQLPEDVKASINRPPLHEAMGYPLAPDLPSGLVPKAIIEEDPYPIKGWILFHRNKAMTEADPVLQKKAFDAVEFSVCIDIYMSETALECDIVLPSLTFYEMPELRDNLTLFPQIILSQPVVPEPYECRSLSEITKGLAQKMGYGQYFQWEKWEDWAEEQLKPVDVSLEEIKARGFWDGKMNYRKYEKGGFNTPSGLIEIYCNNFEKHGYTPLPEYKEHTVLPDKDFPFQMVNQKSTIHKQSKTQNLPFLMEIEGENWMEIHPMDAAKYGIQSGDYVEIESPQDKTTIKTRVREGIRPGVLCVRHGHGFGHWGLGSVAKGKGTYINTLIENNVNPISGGTAFNECKVRIRKI